jgi:ADP-ribosylglycohydrolase
MMGAVCGDVIGSVYEFSQRKGKDFEFFRADAKPTDDSYHTIAMAEAILTGQPYNKLLVDYFWEYPDGGYGGRFWDWAKVGGGAPYNSFGNGAAMRVSPAAWIHTTMEETLAAAVQYTEVTHNHPEGVRGAKAIAAAIFLARQGASQPEIRSHIVCEFGYDLSLSLEEMIPSARFNETCQVTVPQALIAVLEATDFNDAIRNAIALGADSDTVAAIAGSIAEPLFGGIPDETLDFVWGRLNGKLQNVVLAFADKYNLSHLVKLKLKE